MGTFVTQTGTPTLFGSGSKQPAPNQQLRNGWTTRNVAEAADLNAIHDALLDLRTEARANVFNVRHYGATGDGSTDDTAAIQAALDAASAAGRGTVYFPAGTYIVAPTTTTRLIVYSNVELIGDGDVSTIQVKTDAGNYATVIGPADDSTALSNFTMRDLRIDQNAAANTTCNIATGNASIAQHAVRVFVGSDIRIERVRFDSCCGINTVTLNGTSVERVSVRDCRFRFVPTTGVSGYDNSAVYCEATDHEVIGCTFEADIGSKATGAIETHGGPSLVSGNRVSGYLHGVNIVTEASGSLPTNNINVVGNTISDCVIGIRLWSTTGKSLRSVKVANNAISVAQVSHANTSRNAGIEFVYIAGGTLEGSFDGIDIVNNQITFEDEGAGRSYTAAHLCAGILCYPYGAQSNLLISGNVIRRAPATGIKVASNGSQAIKNVKIAGNLISDFGQNVSLISSYRAAFFFTYAISDMVVDGNVLKDDYATRRGQLDIYWDGTAGNSATRCIYRANLLAAADGTSFSRTLTPSMSVEPLAAILVGTKTWDPASVAAGAQTTTTVAVTGATVGDPVSVGFSQDLQSMQLSGYVSAANTVTAVLRNGTAGAVDLASGTLKACVWRQP